MPKRSIRSHFLTERKSRSSQICADSSSEIQRRFMRSVFFREARCLALYSAIHNEVSTDEIVGQALDSGKCLVFPRVSGEDLEFVHIESPSELVSGAFGVKEPKSCNLVPVEKVDLIVVPGVAFDQRGHRLGYGRGYYDRALAKCQSHCMKVGFAYDFQLVEELPATDYDETLSMLITESQTLNFSAF
ncbi:MAG TPA: 5-formyltetrahydrofolate cyclo-ligase [Desulfuromonadales bacterium]|nr:5-formyltetrahydrofolate cyclo-ligase [Desulfuromonadales bacterium]